MNTITLKRFDLCKGLLLVTRSPLITKLTLLTLLLIYLIMEVIITIMNDYVIGDYDTQTQRSIVKVVDDDDPDDECPSVR